MLDNDQMKIINTNSNNIFIKAGAGSGKTRVIIAKINKLLKEGVKPNEILAITFTNKAADEMIERLEGKLNNVFTFHAYCYQVLSSLGIIINLNSKNIKNSKMLQISKYKNSLFKGIKPFGYNKYQKYLRDNNLLDFDDLIIKSLKHIKNHQFKYVFIDEFQDINNLQYELLKRMKKANTKFWAVGDLNQSIYRFRGANNKLIDCYIREYKATVFSLNNNYRCGDKIVKLSNLLINQNYLINKVKYRSLNKNNDSIEFHINNDNDNYINLIFLEIRKASKQYRTIAVLYRYHYEAYDLIKKVSNTFMSNISFYTFHETKGLEFDCIFIINAASIPSLKSYQHKTLLEERRLFYVAITRAKQKLYIYSKKQTPILNKLIKQYQKN